MLPLGPVATSVGVLSFLRSERRGRRRPAGAHAGAVSASLRLHCDARSGVAPPNSLRSLRSLRSNNRGESEDEARSRAPTPALRFWLRLTSAARLLPCAATSLSSPQKSPLPGTACRSATTELGPPHGIRRCLGKGACGQAAARLRGAEKRRARGRARSALRLLTRRSCLNAANEVSVVSFATGPRDRASQGSRSAAQTASPKRCGLPARAIARTNGRGLLASGAPTTTAATGHQRVAPWHSESSAALGWPEGG